MPQLPSLIGIHGLLNSGKDTVADYLQQLHPGAWNRYAFAKPIKEACNALFGFTPERFESRVLKEQVDSYWGFSPRRAMQLLGTEYGRNMLRDDVWIRRAEQEHILNLGKSKGTIITDVRFENEAAWVRSTPNSILIYLKTPNLVIDEKYNHASEKGIVQLESDYEVYNDKSLGLEPLHKQLDEVIRKATYNS